jgi:hypothetical protein
MLSVRLLTVKNRLRASWKSGLDDKRRVRNAQKWGESFAGMRSVKREDDPLWSRYVTLMRFFKSGFRIKNIHKRHVRRSLSERLRLRGEWNLP